MDGGKLDTWRHSPQINTILGDVLLLTSFFLLLSAPVSGALLHSEVSLHHQSPGWGFLHQRWGDASNVYIKNIYILPDHRPEIAIVRHFDFRAPPGKELLMNERVIIWAEGLSKVRTPDSESWELHTDRVAQHLPPPSTPQYLLCWADLGYWVKGRAG